MAWFPLTPCWLCSAELLEVSKLEKQVCVVTCRPNGRCSNTYSQVDGIRSRIEEKYSCKLSSLQGLWHNCIATAELQEPAVSTGDAGAQLCAGAAGNETQTSWMESFGS